MKISSESLAEVEAAFKQYREEVETAALKEATKYDYTRFVDQFVRWLRDEFEPGGTLR